MISNVPKKIHYMTHNFSDFDSDTKHMTRNQRAIYLDLRTLYFTTAHKIMVHSPMIGNCSVFGLTATVMLTVRIWRGC